MQTSHTSQLNNKKWLKAYLHIVCSCSITFMKADTKQTIHYAALKIHERTILLTEYKLHLPQLNFKCLSMHWSVGEHLDAQG